MTKVYKVEIDCADCASKIERAIGKIDGVERVRVNFHTQKLKLTADSSRFDEIVAQAQQVGNRIEPDFAIAR